MKFSVTLTPREMRNLSKNLTPVVLRLIEDLTGVGLSGDRIGQVCNPSGGIGCPPHHFNMGAGDTIRPVYPRPVARMAPATARRFLELVCANQNLTNRLAPPSMSEIREMLLSEKPGNSIRPGTLYYSEIWDCLRYNSPVDALIALPELYLVNEEVEIASDKLTSLLFYTEIGNDVPQPEPFVAPQRWRGPLDANAPEYLNAATGLPEYGQSSSVVRSHQFPTGDCVRTVGDQQYMYLPILTEITGVYDLCSAALVKAIMDNRLALSPQNVAAIESIGVANFLAAFRLDRCAPYLEKAIAQFKAMPVFNGMADQIARPSVASAMPDMDLRRSPEPNGAHIEPYIEPVNEDPNVIHGRTVWKELIDQWRLNYDVDGEQPDRKKLLNRVVNSHARAVTHYLHLYGVTGATREALATLDNVDPDDAELKVKARILAENINSIASAIVPGLCQYMEYDRERADLGRDYDVG